MVFQGNTKNPGSRAQIARYFPLAENIFENKKHRNFQNITFCSTPPLRNMNRHTKFSPFRELLRKRFHIHFISAIFVFPFPPRLSGEYSLSFRIRISKSKGHESRAVTCYIRVFLISSCYPLPCPPTASPLSPLTPHPTLFSSHFSFHHCSAVPLTTLN